MWGRVRRSGPIVARCIAVLTAADALLSDALARGLLKRPERSAQRTLDEGPSSEVTHLPNASHSRDLVGAAFSYRRTCRSSGVISSRGAVAHGRTRRGAPDPRKLPSDPGSIRRARNRTGGPP